MSVNLLSNISIINRDLKRTLRGLISSKYYSAVNLLGLALGLACSFLILLYVLSETGFDKCHKNSDSIFRLTFINQETSEMDARSSELLFQDINSTIPEVQNSFLMGHKIGLVYHRKNQFKASGIGILGDGLFKMLSIEFISGNYLNFKDNLNYIIISKDLKTKLFGKELALGNYVDLKINDKLISFEIIGVVENLSKKSSIQADFFIHFTHLPYVEKFFLAEHYIQVFETQRNIVENKINDLLIDANAPQRVLLQPLKDIHFKSENINNNRAPSGDFNKIILYVSIGLLILISSVINYIILTSSNVIEKSKEIGVRKAFGAKRRNIFSLFMTESLLLAIFSLPIAILISELFLPLAKFLFQNELERNNFNSWQYIVGILTVVLLTGLVSGIYTAMIAAKISPIGSLMRRRTINKTIFQKILLVFQIGVFTGLIIFVFIIRNQLKYCLNYDMGFNKNNIINIDVYNKIDLEQYLTFINEVNKNPSVKECAYGSDIPSASRNISTILHHSIPNKKIPSEYIYASEGFLEICGIELVSGRYFAKELREENNVIVNETAIRALGIDDPIGKIVDNKTIVGVVKDFIPHSLHIKVPPIIIYNNSEDKISTILVSFKSEVNDKIVKEIKSIWNNLFPDERFEANTFNDIYEEMYVEEIRTEKTISIFALLAIIISSLGVFSVVHFATKQRTKEIGIRKVNGANIIDIVKLIYIQSLLTYLMAILWCLPVTYLIGLKWLENFAYSKSIESWEILLSVLLSFTIYSFPIIIQSYKTSIKNPTDALRYE